MPDNERNAHERRLRKVARARGYSLIRFHRREPGGREHKGYLVIDFESDTVILGSEPTTLDNVEGFLMDGATPRQRRRVSPPDRVM